MKNKHTEHEIPADGCKVETCHGYRCKQAKKTHNMDLYLLVGLGVTCIIIALTILSKIA